MYGTAVEPGLALSGVQRGIDWLMLSVATLDPLAKAVGPLIDENHKKGKLVYFSSPVTELVFHCQVCCKVSNSEARFKGVV